MRRLCATLSRALNKATGGRPGESLCARWTRTRGSDCLPCRFVGLVLREPHHCIEQFIWEVRRRVGDKP